MLFIYQGAWLLFSAMAAIFDAAYAPAQVPLAPPCTTHQNTVSRATPDILAV